MSSYDWNYGYEDDWISEEEAQSINDWYSDDDPEGLIEIARVIGFEEIFNTESEWILDIYKPIMSEIPFIEKEDFPF